MTDDLKELIAGSILLVLNNSTGTKAANAGVAAALVCNTIEAAGYVAVPREVLLPFAKEAATHGNQIPDHMLIWDYEGPEGGRNNIRVRDLRRVAELLNADLSDSATTFNPEEQFEKDNEI
jgi:hypothetical protein